MNGNIVGRIDDMSKKIDELEQSIGELVKEAQEEPEADNRAAAQQWPETAKWDSIKIWINSTLN